MTITEILIFAKILALVSGDRTVTVTDVEKKIAAGALKRIAANFGRTVRLFRN